MIENLALRQQLAVLKEKQPRSRLTDSDRFFWIVLSQVWMGWRKSLHVVQPATVVRWNRQGFRYYWRWKSRRLGRPKIDPQIRHLIQRMCRDNQLWGAPRIHGELLKLGFDVSEATVRILHFNVTEHPTAAWTAQQLVEASGLDDAPRYLLRDRDAVYGKMFQHRVTNLGMNEVITAAGSPWQNTYAERVIGSLRRECLDHMIILGELHLKRILSDYVDYYNGDRTHLSLKKDAPDGREGQSFDEGRVVTLKRVGGLHHFYEKIAA